MTVVGNRLTYGTAWQAPGANVQPSEREAHRIEGLKPES